MTLSEVPDWKIVSLWLRDTKPWP